MQAGRRYTFIQVVQWTSKYILIFLIFDSIPVILYHFLGWEWLSIPWQPISLIGIAVAFYLGFKNNSSYERLWEARKIWGGIVNASRSFTVMARDFINNDQVTEKRNEETLAAIRRKVVHRHVAWLRSLAIELRKVKKWEHHDKRYVQLRELLGVAYGESQFDQLKPYLSQEDFQYIMSKGNRSSHLLSQQSRHLMQLREEGLLEHFRHLEMQGLITEFYTLQGKSERIKNFPFPRQYASINYIFVILFIILLPFGMLNVFTAMEQSGWIWAAIPFSLIGSWVFWLMEMIGDYSENPFEGLHNDVPITSMAIGIERDIRQMLDETDLPEPLQAQTELDILI